MTRTVPGKILSGGQTGVDRAALDFAIERGIPWGGWAPKGWRSEDPGGVPERYREHMRECPGDYVERTHRNVLDSTATLIVRPSIGFRSPGTVMTMDYASKIGAGRPGGVWRFRRSVSLDDDQGRVVALWVPVVDLRVLNIAGPRESKAPGIYAATLALLREVWP